jgi:predicted transcriptional regulator
MLTVEIPNELEEKLRTLAEQEQITPELVIKKLINDQSANPENKEFFSFAGLWQGRDISQKTLRERAWGN